jgi:hypothetical protein
LIDSKHTALYKFKNGEDAQLRHKFTTAGETTFIAISKDLVRRFNIDENTWAHQYATENGIYIAFKGTKYRNGRPTTTTKPDDQDYGE